MLIVIMRDIFHGLKAPLTKSHRLEERLLVSREVSNF